MNLVGPSWSVAFCLLSVRLLAVKAHGACSMSGGYLPPQNMLTVLLAGAMCDGNVQGLGGIVDCDCASLLLLYFCTIAIHNTPPHTPMYSCAFSSSCRFIGSS